MNCLMSCLLDMKLRSDISELKVGNLVEITSYDVITDKIVVEFVLVVRVDTKSETCVVLAVNSNTVRTCSVSSKF
jgi:ribosomal protein S26